MSVKQVQQEKKPLITLIDFLGGASAGITQVLVGQPFDLIKVRLQTEGGNIGQIVKEIYLKDGLKGFYKGTLSPLIGMSFCIATQFTGFNFAKRVIANLRYDGKTEKINTFDLVLSGMFSGLCYTWIMSPMELFRIKMQVKEEGQTKYKSSIDAGKQILKTQGFRGVYFGYFGTTLRESIGSGIYFGVYETMMAIQLPKYNNDRKQIPIYQVMGFGGFAGYFLWTFVFPIDIIKSKMQGSNFDNSPYRSFFKTGSQLFKQRGITGMFSGLIPCQARAILANGSSFVVYEWVNDNLIKLKNKNKGI